MPQNTSHAVMQQRHEAKDSLDDFPTPPWATRALIKHVLKPLDLSWKSVLEPACGRGHMARTLNESFEEVFATDIFDYGYKKMATKLDFMTLTPPPGGWAGPGRPDWIITNPPFRLAEKFALKGLENAADGVALLVRSAFLEGVGRFNHLFDKHPPAVIAQFAERVPMHRGRLLENGSTATAYCWVVWDKQTHERTRFKWIPPCRRQLERPGDYA